MADVVKGTHLDIGNQETVLIQIQDFGAWQFAVPFHKEKFCSVHQFRFDDIATESKAAINEEQASHIAQILQEAKQQGHNVLVHCHAGICRSGAVSEVGVIYGFKDLQAHRIPNTRVKDMVRRALGITNSWE